MGIVVTTGDESKDNEIVQNALNEIEIEKKEIENEEVNIDLNININHNEQTPPPLTVNEPIPSKSKDDDENAPNILFTEHEKQQNLASIIEALDNDKNESINDDETESEQSTDDESKNETDSSFHSSDNEDVYDLADYNGLEQMMSIRDDFGKNKLISGVISSKNVFAEIGKQQSRKALQYEKEDQNKKTNELMQINEYEDKILEMMPSKKDKNVSDQTRAAQILSSNTSDFIQEEDVPTFADMNDTNKSATIRAFEPVTKLSTKHVQMSEDNEYDENEEYGKEYTASRRIWYIFRCFVVIYLFISTSFQFAFTFNENQWTARIILLLFFNIICDIFMWINIFYEFLNFRDFIDDSNDKVIKSLNESK